MKSTTPTFVKTLTVCGMAVGLLTGMQPANAAGPTIPGLGGPTAVSVGAYWPSSGDAKDVGGSTQINGDLSYRVPVTNPLTVPARTVLDVGVEAGTNHGNHNTIIPVTVGEVFGMNKQSPLATGNFYVGAGVGAYILNQSGLSTATRLGGYVNAGYNFSPSTFAEAKYQFVNHGDGTLLNLGYRF